MAISNLKDLKAKQKEMENQVSLRNEGKSSAQEIEVLVGLATCGFAVGADLTKKALEKRVKKDKLNIKVIGVGCIGYCYKEPTLQVNIPGKAPLLYGEITEDKVDEFVDTVLVKQEKMDDYFIKKSFEKAVL
jgi:NADP-reducing hydrogenase subunit HndB